MNEVALRANDVLRNDVMLRINDVALRTELCEWLWNFGTTERKRRRTNTP